MRIDSLRNQLKSTIDLLETVAVELDDLHVLAYDRATAAEEAHVAGGSRDYALDTHGDRRARDALRHLAERTVDACGLISYAANEAGRLLQGEDTGRRTGPRTATAIEIAEQIAAQGRRIARGEYVSHRRLPQPASTLAWSKLVAAKETAERENTRLARQVSELTDQVARLEGYLDGRERRDLAS